MKMAVGVKSQEEAEYFFGHGAAEVYCGLTQLHNNRLSLENFSRPEDVRHLIKLAAKSGRKVFLAANEIVSPRDYPLALRLTGSLADAGLAGLIVRDPALLAYFKKKGFRFYFTLSTLTNCFNSLTLEFFAGLGISRIVLPMQLMPENAAGLIKNRFGIETEVFCQALYYGVNVDSLCSLPCPQTSEAGSRDFADFTCLLPFKSPQGRYFMPMPPPEYMFNAFYDYYKAGVGYVKVARWPNIAREADLFLKVRYLVKLLEKGIKRELFVHEGLRLDAKPMEYGKSFTSKPLRG